jgi:hypothetical protein
MFPSCHPCINLSEHEAFGGLFHHPMENVTNTNKGITKKRCQTIISKGLYVEQKKRICKTHWTSTQKNMEYDGMNEDAINPNGKCQWCLWIQSMSMLKREENMVKSGKQMIAYEQCMKFHVMLNPSCTK